MQHMQITIELRSFHWGLIQGNLIEPSCVPRQIEHNHSLQDGKAISEK